MFLQIFDEGRLTDGKGRTVNFKNTVMIMTSNLGAKIIQEAGENISEEVEDKISELVKNTFPPEFLNRLDQVIMFEPLSREELVKIVDLQVSDLIDRLERRGIKIEIDKEVEEYLAKVGHDPIFGARPLKRIIQSEILDKLAIEILEKDISDKQIRVRLVNEKMKIVGGNIYVRYIVTLLLICDDLDIENTQDL